MNDKPVIDPERDRAFRRMIVENARADRARRPLRHRASFLVGLVTAAVLLSGGGVAVALTGAFDPPEPAHVETATPEPVPTPTPIATPTATATAAPVPAPTPVPAETAAAADLSAWVIGFDGIGPIAFGGSSESASAALDTTALVPYDFGIEECRSDRRGSAENPQAWIMAVSDEPGRVTLLNVFGYGTDATRAAAAFPRTAEGIGIGSTEQELLAAYPGITPADPVAGDALYALSDGSGRTLWFRIAADQGTVVDITLNEHPVLTIGGCGA
ncbi:hypothetical protein EDF22_2737 [Rathayibacter sp. PhB127]|uniref:hypothetical protein n=1 Tax=Rathayibacter sp. PhB127 TaxID=2485176 RepID=UPI000F4D2109|nr:hypothetical protein [Rathayibacter sp. PhB127]ROS25523.1 hypothetical protein EDF22_2737 [Rathayibacter sp. PhB127]